MYKNYPSQDIGEYYTYGAGKINEFSYIGEI